MSSHRGEAARIVLSVADEGELVGVEHHDPPASGGREAVVLLVAMLEPRALTTRTRQLCAVEVVQLVVAYDADRRARRAAQRRQRRLGGTCMGRVRHLHGICMACARHVHGMSARFCMLAPPAHCRSDRGRR